MKISLTHVSIITVTFLLHGCTKHCYPTELQLTAEIEKKNCHDLGWRYWEREAKKLRTVVCTDSSGETWFQFAATDQGLCEMKHLRDNQEY